MIVIPPRLPHLDPAMSWRDVARQCKEDWVAHEPNPDMPQVLIARRGGRNLAMVITRSPDRNAALTVVARLRIGFDADEIVFVSDSYMLVTQAPAEPSSDAGAPAVGAAAPNLVPGELARRWAAGDRDGISESLVVLVASRQDVTTASLSYTMQEKRLAWTDRDETENLVQVSGLVPDALRQIMALEPITANPEFAAIAGLFGFTRERALFHASRATLFDLARDGHRVFEMVTSAHLEWAHDKDKNEDRGQRLDSRSLYDPKAN